MKKSKLIIDILLNISVLIFSLCFLLPINYIVCLLFLFVMCLQPVILFFNCKRAESNIKLYFLNTLLMLSNLAGLVFYKIWYESADIHFDFGDIRRFMFYTYDIVFWLLVVLTVIVAVGSVTYSSIKRKNNSVLLTIVALLLSVSACTIMLPCINSISILVFVIFLQIGILIWYHNVLKNFAIYLACTIILMVSNIASCVAMWTGCTAFSSVINNELSQAHGYDFLGVIVEAFGAVLLTLALTAVFVTVIVLCIVSIIRRSILKNKERQKYI